MPDSCVVIVCYSVYCYSTFTFTLDVVKVLLCDTTIIQLISMIFNLLGIFTFILSARAGLGRCGS